MFKPLPIHYRTRPDGPDGTLAELLVAPDRDSRGKPVISTQKALTKLVRQTREMDRVRGLTDVLGRLVRGPCPPGHRARHPAGGSAGGSQFGDARTQLVATIREAIGQADLSESAAERLRGLLQLKVEVARNPPDLGSDYDVPEAPLRVPSLHPPANRPTDPWPFIDAVRASAFAVLEAAMLLGVGLGRREYRDGSSDFPDLEDRIQLAIVVARSAFFCAQTEAQVKNRLYGRTDNDPDTCWPQGVRRELRRHEMALTSHRALQIRRRRFPSVR